MLLHLISLISIKQFTVTEQRGIVGSKPRGSVVVLAHALDKLKGVIGVPFGRGESRDGGDGGLVGDDGEGGHVAEGAEAVVEGSGFEGGVGDGVGAKVEEGVKVVLVEARVVRNGVVVEGNCAEKVHRLGA